MESGNFYKTHTGRIRNQRRYIFMGAAMRDGHANPEAQVKIPFKTLNRHGLIAGATGTGI